MSIISISGRIGSGKDTVGKIIQIITDNPQLTDKAVEEWLPRQLYPGKFEIQKWANALKDIVCILIGCTREQLEDHEFKETELGEEWWYYGFDGGLKIPYLDNGYNKGQEPLEYLIKPTPRLILQLMGTECGRNIIHPSIWVNSLMSKYPKTIEPVIEKEIVFNKPIPLEITTNNQKEIKFKCHCGTIFISTLWRVNSGHTKSCSCYQKYKMSIIKTSHGDSNSRLLSIYKNMKTRCTNKNSDVYKKYGEKGITICEAWLNSYEVFREWATNNGYQEHLSLDRRDSLGNYEPNNCRWILLAEQSKNKEVYANNALGVRGVSKLKANGKFRAQIQNNGKKIVIGQYNTVEEASEAYEKQRKLLFDIKEPIIEPKEDKVNWILTDTRYPNELKAVEDKDGITIRVIRPLSYDNSTLSYAENLAKKQEEFDNKQGAFHPSETALDNAEFDWTIENDGSVLELIEQVREILIAERII